MSYAGSKFGGIVSIATASKLIEGNLTLTGSAQNLGEEVITVAVDRDMSGANAWVGTGWAVGTGIYTHTAGVNAATLTGYAARTGSFYRVTMTIVTGAAGDLTISYGGASITIPATIGTLTAYNVLFNAISTAGLVITPDALWAGSIDNVSIVSSECNNITVQAHPNNAALVYVGKTSLTTDLVHSYVLTKGSSVTFSAKNANLLWVYGTAADKVSWGGES